MASRSGSDGKGGDMASGICAASGGDMGWNSSMDDEASGTDGNRGDTTASTGDNRGDTTSSTGDNSGDMAAESSAGDASGDDRSGDWLGFNASYFIRKCLKAVLQYGMTCEEGLYWVELTDH
ncbi:hypothetical protein BJV82DRAFT_577190 [Fennellomyces sp. T-0311]|nr:hypothetical protein BJV82DRAFT_577190 [Fennellomyces sp. T-0311]